MTYDPAYLTNIACLPKALPNHGFKLGYALFNRDLYFPSTLHSLGYGVYYEEKSENKDLRGPIRPTRRSILGPPNFNEEDGVVIVREINSTRPPTADEMENYLGYVQCKNSDCKGVVKENEKRMADTMLEIVEESPIPDATTSPMILTKLSEVGVTTTTAQVKTIPTGSGPPKRRLLPHPKRAKVSYQHLRRHRL